MLRGRRFFLCAPSLLSPLCLVGLPVLFSYLHAVVQGVVPSLLMFSYVLVHNTRDEGHLLESLVTDGYTYNQWVLLLVLRTPCAQ